MALTPNQIAQLAYNAGFRGSALRMAVAVALAESGGNPNAYNPESAAGTARGSGSRGLWQIYGTAHPWANSDIAFNPVFNAQAAYRVYKEAGNSFHPWSTFNNGSAHQISQSLRLDMPTGQIDLVGGGPVNLSGGRGNGVISQNVPTSSSNATLTQTETRNPLVRLFPQPVEDFLVKVTSDPQGIKKTIAFGVLGFTLLVIGLIMLIAQTSPGQVAGEALQDAGGLAVQTAVAAAL